MHRLKLEDRLGECSYPCQLRILVRHATIADNVVVRLASVDRASAEYSWQDYERRCDALEELCALEPQVSVPITRSALNSFRCWRQSSPGLGILEETDFGSLRLQVIALHSDALVPMLREHAWGWYQNVVQVLKRMFVPSIEPPRKSESLATLGAAAPVPLADPRHGPTPITEPACGGGHVTQPLILMWNPHAFPHRDPSHLASIAREQLVPILTEPEAGSRCAVLLVLDTLRTDDLLPEYRNELDSCARGEDQFCRCQVRRDSSQRSDARRRCECCNCRFARLEHGLSHP